VDPAGDVSGRSERPALYIEWGGHGVFGFDPVHMKKLERDSYSRVAPEQTPEEPLDRARFFVYRIGAEADDPADAREGEFRFQLLSIRSEFWERRADVGKGRLFWSNYSYGGSRLNLGSVPAGFAGEKWTTARANPPWGWFDEDRRDVLRGDWFFDPALFVLRTFQLNEKAKGKAAAFGEPRFSLEYIDDPYLLKID
jgi:hypothetical protein